MSDINKDYPNILPSNPGNQTANYATIAQLIAMNTAELANLTAQNTAYTTGVGEQLSKYNAGHLVTITGTGKAFGK